MKLWVFWELCVIVACQPAAKISRHQYAMYQAVPEEYRVFLVGSAVNAPLTSVNGELRRLQRADRLQVNLAFRKVDTLSQLPSGLAEKVTPLHGLEAGNAPLYIVVSPSGKVLLHQSLTASSLNALVHSPMRTRLAESLSRSDCVVVLVARSGDLASARTVVKEAAGELLLRGRVATEVIELDRSDGAEATFVNNLTLFVALPTEQPLAFVVYGRGRVLPPVIVSRANRPKIFAQMELVTTGLTETPENLPGEDLLIAHDWNSAAVKLARVVDGDTGNEPFFVEEFAESADFEDPAATGPKPQSVDTAPTQDRVGPDRGASPVSNRRLLIALVAVVVLIATSAILWRGRADGKS